MLGLPLDHLRLTPPLYTAAWPTRPTDTPEQ